MGKKNSPINYIVFSDASVRSNHDKTKTYCGYGTVVLNVESMKYVKFGGSLGDKSIVYGEGYAIYEGIKYLVKEIVPKKGDIHVLVVTDNKLTVDIFTEYIPYSWDISGKIWRKRDGSAVKNYELYRDIYNLIEDEDDIHVNIVHMNSHFNESNYKMIQSKLKEYGVRANKETSKVFIRLNAVADEIATEITYNERAKDTNKYSGRKFKEVPQITHPTCRGKKTKVKTSKPLKV